MCGCTEDESDAVSGGAVGTMLSIGFILAIVAILTVSWWLVQAWRGLRFCQMQIGEVWQQLLAELAARREMIPYLVTAAPSEAAALGSVIGNACDLAANVEGVLEVSQAETRLSAALSRLAILLGEAPDAATNANLDQLRTRLHEMDERVGLLRGAYNRQSDTFNALLDRPAGRLLAYAQFFRKASLF